MDNYIGARWLINHFNIQLTGKLRHKSKVGTNKNTREKNGYIEVTYPTTNTDSDSDVRSHILFHLKKEIINFELLARIFEIIDPSIIQQWINESPSGAYARRTAFLYEWFTGKELTKPYNLSGSYVAAIDDNKLVAATPEFQENSSRWHVYDNMPGTPYFCPSIAKVQDLNDASNLNIPALLQNLEDEVGADMITRAAVWMTERESRASFAIESEGNNTSRIQRFAKVIGKRTGTGKNAPLTQDDLKILQGEVLGPDTTLTSLGIRQSPVFIGDTSYGPFPEDRVHYIAPQSEDLQKMLNGILIFLKRTQGQSPVMRAAVASFGFVYIHPLADGNGRIHRFLMNDILRRDQAVTEDIILPISAVINEDTAIRKEYELTLEKVSKPLMDLMRPHIKFDTQLKRYPDGIQSDLYIDPVGSQLALPTWRFPKLESHVIFISKVIREAVEGHMRMEATYLKRIQAGRKAIKEVLEMPNTEADRILRSYSERPGKAFGKSLLKDIEALSKKGRAEKIKKALDIVWKENPVHDEPRTKFFESKKTAP